MLYRRLKRFWQVHGCMYAHVNFRWFHISKHCQTGCDRVSESCRCASNEPEAKPWSFWPSMHGKQLQLVALAEDKAPVKHRVLLHRNNACNCAAGSRPCKCTVWKESQKRNYMEDLDVDIKCSSHVQGSFSLCPAQTSGMIEGGHCSIHGILTQWICNRKEQEGMPPTASRDGIELLQKCLGPT